MAVAYDTYDANGYATATRLPMAGGRIVIRVHDTINGRSWTAYDGPSGDAADAAWEDAKRRADAMDCG